MSYEMNRTSESAARFFVDKKSAPESSLFAISAHRLHLATLQPRPLCRQLEPARTWIPPFGKSAEVIIGGFHLKNWRITELKIDPSAVCRKCLSVAAESLGIVLFKEGVIPMQSKYGSDCVDCWRKIIKGEWMYWSKSDRTAHCFVCVIRRWQLVEERINGEVVKLFSFNDTVAVQTDESIETEFTKKYNAALREVQAEGKLGDDFPLFMDRAQARYAEIICKMRGYKADVDEKRLLTSGDLPPMSEACVVSINNAGKVEELEAVPSSRARKNKS